MRFVQLIAGTLCVSTLAMAQWYEVTELPPLPQLEGQWDRGIQAINDAGEVLAVGAAVGDSKFRSFLFIGSQWREIVVSNYTLATGLNNHGQVTGRAIDNDADGPVYPFIWSTNGFAALPLPNHFATAINDRGELAGFFNDRVFLWHDGHLMTVEANSAEYWPLLNNRGELALTGGYAGRVTALFVSRGRIRNIGPNNDHTWAYSMNNRGDVVGGFRDGPTAHAYVYSHGKFIDLQRERSQQIGVAYLVNDRQDIVGWVRYEDGRDATFLIRRGKWFDLRDLVEADASWDFGIPSAINQLGQLAGIGVHSGRTVGYILTPVERKPGRGRGRVSR